MVEYTFSYTTVAGDVGNDLKIRVGLEHFNTIGGLCQVVTDDWQVEGPEPATLGLLLARLVAESFSSVVAS